MAMTLLYSVSVRAGYTGQAIVFPEFLLPLSSKAVPSLQQHGSAVAVNFFYTAEYQQTRLLAELFADGLASIDQFGRRFNRATQQWSAALP